MFIWPIRRKIVSHTFKSHAANAARFLKWLTILGRCGSKGLSVLFFQLVDVVFFFLDGETSLNVIITDVNDNSPLFTNDTYTIHQQEEVLGETDMMNITADDADSGSNSLIDYVIESGNISKYGKDYIVVFLPSFVLISNF